MAVAIGLKALSGRYVFTDDAMTKMDTWTRKVYLTTPDIVKDGWAQIPNKVIVPKR